MLSELRRQMVPVYWRFYVKKGTSTFLPTNCRSSVHLGLNHKTEITKLREPFAVAPGKSPKAFLNGEEAFIFLKDGSTVFIQGGAATPTILISEFYNYIMAKKLRNISAYHIHTEGPFPITNPEANGHVRSVSLFTGSNCRNPIKSGRADYVPIFLSEIPHLFRRNIIKLDVALLNISPPDLNGYCSLGPSVDVTRAAVESAKHLVGQINPSLPVTSGDAHVHISNFTCIINGDMPCHFMKARQVTDVEDKIGALIADNLISDGATLQTGIGAIPDSVLAKLTNHRNLGVHTEMFSDGIIELVERGIITNANKVIRPGKIVTSFVIGTEKVFKFVHDNPLIEFRDVAWVNSPSIIARNPKPVAINSCIEVDLSGQVVSDSIGSRIYSGFGGQVDFIRGAAIAEDGLGMPIIALPSSTKHGESKICPSLKPGAGVVTSRAHAHYIVTEYGIAYLFGRTLRQRAHALIQIAHPDHRESLEKAAFEQLKVMPSAQ
ncbi:4-hydroxybutyrate coenzyme A transferase [Schistosoma japonicum]|nr:4-hydroxybutyrate coenzyme A transferase [Schistosoma japonicum]